jgi:hypothetical protein
MQNGKTNDLIKRMLDIISRFIYEMLRIYVVDSFIYKSDTRW